MYFFPQSNVNTWIRSKTFGCFFLPYDCGFITSGCTWKKYVSLPVVLSFLKCSLSDLSQNVHNSSPHVCLCYFKKSNLLDFMSALLFRGHGLDVMLHSIYRMIFQRYLGRACWSVFFPDPWFFLCVQYHSFFEPTFYKMDILLHHPNPQLFLISPLTALSSPNYSSLLL